MEAQTDAPMGTMVERIVQEFFIHRYHKNTRVVNSVGEDLERIGN